MNIALAGLQRNARGVQVTAENVANVNTDGYHARRYDPGSDSVTLSNEAPFSADGLDHAGAQISDVDLATE
jgi:flagellar hook-associated protein FlgK